MDEKEESFKENKLLFMIIRYFILILLGVLFSGFYKILLPLTIQPLYFLLSLFTKVSLSGNIIFTTNGGMQIVDSCLAGSAYFLLLILTLTVSMKIKTRIYSVIFRQA